MDGYQAEWDAYERKFALDLMWDTQRALAVDELWTAALVTPAITADVRSNLPLLQTVVEEMVKSITDITSRTGELEGLIDRKALDLDNAFDHVLRHTGRDAPRSASLRDIVGEACATLRAESWGEIEAIQAKLLELGEGELAAGDWGPNVTKALQVVAGAASLVAVVAMPGILLVPAAIGTAASAVAAVTTLAQAFG
jgi:hypothetical protein